jgi:hypothetical protein
MTILIVALAWIVLSLLGWSLLRVAAHADRNSRVQSMRPWERDSFVSTADVREHARCDVISAGRNQARAVQDRRARVRAGNAG